MVFLPLHVETRHDVVPPPPIPINLRDDTIVMDYGVSLVSPASMLTHAVELIFFSLATVFKLAMDSCLVVVRHRVDTGRRIGLISSATLTLAVKLVLLPSTTVLTLTPSWSSCHQPP